MTKPPEKKTPTIRNSTGIVIIVLCVVAMLAIGQYLTHGSLTKDEDPQNVVRASIIATAPDPSDVDITDVFPPQEIRAPYSDDMANLVRVKYRSRAAGKGWIAYDKACFVVKGEVKSVEDWTPELETRIKALLDQYKPK